MSTSSPTVTIKLDDSEITRLEKLRILLKLSHWSGIKTEYKIEASEAVRERLETLKKTDRQSYADKFESWRNKYSDYELFWTKHKDY